MSLSTESSGLVDSFGRTIDYLRISITDRCNLACVYCMPPEGIALRSRGELLTFAQYLTIARIAVRLGVRKIRLTGGEPLVRAGIVTFIEQLARLPYLVDLSLTTNGTRLFGLAHNLARAGLKRINVSLDSLKKERFREITRGAKLDKVLDGIQVARKAGLKVKINTVVIRGVNDQELFDFVRFAQDYQVTVRFIEFMPLCGSGWNTSHFIASEELKQRLAKNFALQAGGFDGVAEEYRLSDGIDIGFIHSLSHPFCERCRRLRLSAWGTLRPCLFSNNEVDLKPALWQEDEKAVISGFYQAVGMKPRAGVLDREAEKTKTPIRSIGG